METRIEHNGCEIVAVDPDPEQAYAYVLTIQRGSNTESVHFKENWGNATKRAFKILHEPGVDGVTLYRETSEGLTYAFSL